MVMRSTPEVRETSIAKSTSPAAAPKVIRSPTLSRYVSVCSCLARRGKRLITRLLRPTNVSDSTEIRCISTPEPKLQSEFRDLIGSLAPGRHLVSSGRTSPEQNALSRFSYNV